MPKLHVEPHYTESLPQKLAHAFYWVGQRLSALGLKADKLWQKIAPSADKSAAKDSEAESETSPQSHPKPIYGISLDRVENFYQLYIQSTLSAIGRGLAFCWSKVTLGIKTFVDAVLKISESAYLTMFPFRRHKEWRISETTNAHKQKFQFILIGIVGFLLSKGVTVLPPRHMVTFAILPICIFLMFSKPMYGLILYIIMSISNITKTIWNFPKQIFGIPLFMGTPLLMVAILSWIIESIRSRQKISLHYDSLYIPVMAFWSSLVFSFVFADVSPEMLRFHIGDITLMSSWFITYAAIVSFIKDDETQYKFVMYTMAAIYGFFAYKILRMASYYGFGTEYTVDADLKGRLADNNELASVINMSIPLFYCLHLNQTKKYHKLLFLGLFILGIVGVIYTRSRAGLLCCTLIMSLLFFRVMLPRAKNKLLPVMLLCIIFLGGSFLFRDRIASRVESIMNWKHDQSARNRILSIATALNMMKKHPWVGIGIGTMSTNTGLVMMKYMPDVVTLRTGFGDDDYVIITKIAHGLEIHNAYMSTGGKTGVVSLACFILLYISGITKMIRLRRRIRSEQIQDVEWAYNISYALELGLLAHAFSGIFINNSSDGSIYIYIALCSSLSNVVFKPNSRMNPGMVMLFILFSTLWLYYTVMYRA